MRNTLIRIGLAGALLVAPHAGQSSRLPEGRWQASLASPGGPLNFGLELRSEQGILRAWVCNGEERIGVDEVTLENGADHDTLVLSFGHYDSKLIAPLKEPGRLAGYWRKTRGPGGQHVSMPFEAALVHSWTPPATERFELPPPDGIGGRWRVQFASEEHPSVALFEQRSDGSVLGTFLTTTGDYRYLFGTFGDGRLELSTFDGAHAFLFRAELTAEGSLSGHFWSGDRWHDTWSAAPDPQAALADPLSMVQSDPEVALSDLAYPDLDGQLQSLADPRFDGRARLIVLFGSWCPNCHDEAPFLAELDRRYRARGLAITGLAFELGGDAERDAGMVRRFRERHGIEFPTLLASGSNDKAKAAESFPLLREVAAYPTTLFFDARGELRAVHTGFSGPATGAEHEKLRLDFEQRIESLLAVPPQGELPLTLLAGRTWFQREGVGGTSWEFRTRENGELGAWRVAHGSGVYALEEGWVPCEAGWLGVRLGAQLFVPRLDARELWCASGEQASLTTGEPRLGTPESWVQGLRSRNPRERLVALQALRALPSGYGLLDDDTRARLAADPDRRVREQTRAWTSR